MQAGVLHLNDSLARIDENRMENVCTWENVVRLSLERFMQDNKNKKWKKILSRLDEKERHLR